MTKKKKAKKRDDGFRRFVNRPRTRTDVPMKEVTIQLSEDEYMLLTSLAEEQHMALADVIRGAVQDHFVI